MDEIKVLPGEPAIKKVSHLKGDIWGDLIRPLNEREFEALKKSIAEYGILDPLLIYDNVVIDGHHRLQAAQELGLEEVPCCKMTFSAEGFERESIIRIVYDKNVARRQFTPAEYDEVLGRLYNLEKKAGPGRPEKEESPEIRDEECRKDDDIIEKPKRTTERIAKKTGVSPKKVERAGSRVEFTDEHPEFASDPTANVLELKKLDKQFRKDFGDDMADELYARAPKVAKAHSCDRMTAKEFGKVMQMMLEGWANTPVEALDAVFTITEDGRTFADDCLNPPLVDDAGAEEAEKAEEHPVSPVPAEDTAAEIKDTVRVVLDGIAYMIVAEERDIEDTIIKELLQLYRTIFREEMISDEVRNSLVA